MDDSLVADVRDEQSVDDSTVSADRRAGRAGGVRGRRRSVLIGTATFVIAAVSGVGALGLGGGEPDPNTDGSARPGGTVKVIRGTLAEETAVKGELGYGPEVPLPVRASGTVTWLPQRDATVKRGQTVLRVDDRPVVLLYGALPMYRDLSVATSGGSGQAGDDSGTARRGGGTEGPGQKLSTSAGEAASTGEGSARAGASAGEASGPVRGADVRQFEENLAALGYTGFTVDDTFSAKTAEAVKRWQKALGLPQTGTVKVGDVVYAGGPIRIARTGVRVGTEASTEAVNYSSTSRMVTVDASAADMAWAQRGNAVTVDLPDGAAARGQVASVGTDASPAEGSGSGSGGGEGGAEGATVPVVITFADQKALGRLESGPVTVRYVGRERKGVLTVPVVALVALAEGGYGLEPTEAKDGDKGGAGRYVAVTTGLVADGKAEVSGPGVREGMTVRIPK
ncbi:peptidoglycan-binding protein [Streptomyces sp. NPDC052013]|uniref:peptidoglycan-binding protein n=1 Tax=Streptomyces sp. NPDC052013 TaxID=3365679 RepID=UPI0037D8FACE